MLDTPQIQIQLEGFGIDVPAVKWLDFRTSFINPVDSFSFGFVPKRDGKTGAGATGDPKLKAELLLEPVKISVDGKLQIVGRIWGARKGRQGSGEIVCSGKGYLFDMENCNVDPTVNIKEGMTLKQALLQVAAPYGIANVRGEDGIALRNIQSGVKLNGQPPSPIFLQKPLKDYKPQPARESPLRYMSRVAARHGVQVAPTERRDTIALIKPDYAQPPAWSLHRAWQGEGNNVLESDASWNLEKICTHYLRTAKVSAAAGDESEVKDLAATVPLDLPSAEIPRDRVITDRLKPGVVKSDLGLYRLSYVKDGDSKDAEQLHFAQTRDLAELIRDMLTYSVSMSGYKRDGGIVTHNTIIRVYDEPEHVFEDMWIAERSTSIRVQGGTTTRLKCHLKGAYIF